MPREYGCAKGIFRAGSVPSLRECSPKSQTFQPFGLLRSYRAHPFRREVQHADLCSHSLEARTFSTRAESHQAASTSGTDLGTPDIVHANSSRTRTAQLLAEHSQAENRGAPEPANGANGKSQTAFALKEAPLGSTPIGASPRKGSKAAKEAFLKEIQLHAEKVAGLAKGRQRAKKPSQAEASTAVRERAACKPAAGVLEDSQKAGRSSSQHGSGTTALEGAATTSTASSVAEKAGRDACSGRDAPPGISNNPSQKSAAAIEGLQGKNSSKLSAADAAAPAVQSASPSAIAEAGKVLENALQPASGAGSIVAAAASSSARLKKASDAVGASGVRVASSQSNQRPLEGRGAVSSGTSKQRQTPSRFGSTSAASRGAAANAASVSRNADSKKGPASGRVIYTLDAEKYASVRAMLEAKARPNASPHGASDTQLGKRPWVGKDASGDSRATPPRTMNVRRPLDSRLRNTPRDTDGPPKADSRTPADKDSLSRSQQERQQAAFRRNQQTHAIERGLRLRREAPFVRAEPPSRLKEFKRELAPPIDEKPAAPVLANVSDDEEEEDDDEEDDDSDSEDMDKAERVNAKGKGNADLFNRHKVWGYQGKLQMATASAKRTSHKKSMSHFHVPCPTMAEEQQYGPREGFYRNLLERNGLLNAAHFDNMRVNGYVMNRLLASVYDWRAVFWIVRDLRHYLDYINIATAMHRIAKLSAAQKVHVSAVRQYKEYHILIAFLRKRARHMAGRQLSNIVWALGTLREDKGDGIFQYFIDSITERGFNESWWKDQELSNVIWAVAVMGIKDRKLLDMVKDLLVSRNITQFSPQAIANMAWGFASLNYTDPKLYQALAENSYAMLHSFQPQAIANMLWAFSSINFYHEGLYRAAAAQTTARIKEYNCQELSNTLLAFARVNVVDDAMMEAMEAELPLEHRVTGMARQGLSNVLWSFATLRYYPQAVLDKYIDEFMIRLDQLHEKELSNMVWSIARLGYHPGDRLLSISDRIESTLHEFSPQACSNLLWALSILQGPKHLPCFQKLIDHFGGMDVRDVEIVQLHQLFQALLIARKESEAIGGPQVIIPREVEASVTRVWKELVKNVNVSGFQDEVSMHLTSMGVKHIVEYKAEEGLFSLDIAFSGPNGMRVALEVDGPYHFTVNNHKPLGSSRLRHRLLTAHGWTVVSVAYYEYFSLKGRREKIAYLANKLIDIGIPLPREMLEVPDGQRPMQGRQEWNQVPRTSSQEMWARKEGYRQIGIIKSNPLSASAKTNSGNWARKRIIRQPLRAKESRESASPPDGEKPLE